MSSSDDIFQRVSGTLTELFDIEPGRIHLETRLIDDLGLDSIDAIDLAARVEEMTGKRLEEEKLRELKLVGDVVNLLEEILNNKAAK